jgi:hypothetical protein
MVNKTTIRKFHIRGFLFQKKKFGPTKDKCIEKLLLARKDDGPAPCLKSSKHVPFNKVKKISDPYRIYPDPDQDQEP